MARHVFAYGSFNVGRYKSGPRKHDIYVQDQRGRFVGGELRKQVLRDVFAPKRTWRLTLGLNWVVQRSYYSTKIQAWGNRAWLRAQRQVRGWDRKVLRKAMEDFISYYPDHAKYVDLKNLKWRDWVAGWFPWEVNVAWDLVSRRGRGVEGPGTEEVHS